MHVHAKLKAKCGKINYLKRIILVSNGTICRTQYFDLIATAILRKHWFNSAEKMFHLTRQDNWLCSFA